MLLNYRRTHAATYLHADANKQQLFEHFQQLFNTEINAKGNTLKTKLAALLLLFSSSSWVVAADREIFYRCTVGDLTADYLVTDDWYIKAPRAKAWNALRCDQDGSDSSCVLDGNEVEVTTVKIRQPQRENLVSIQTINKRNLTYKSFTNLGGKDREIHGVCEKMSTNDE